MHLVLIRLLPIVGLPGAVSQFEIGEDSGERRILGGAGVHPKSDFLVCLGQMANTHLMPDKAVLGILNTEVLAPAAEPVPHVTG